MKDPALQRRVVELLPEALDLTGAALERFLDQHCGDDAELRGELEALIGDASKVGDDFLQAGAAVMPDTLDLGDAWQPPLSPSTTTLPEPVEQLPAPETLGRYRIIERLGKGGMGAVYLGEQTKPVRRRAALKVIDSIHDRGRQHQRFAAECQALARLSHPNVAALYEVGTTDDDHPFVAMEPVEGLPITDWCDQHELGFKRRIELFCGVCAGVRHAHEKGVLHRDIKPANVLVTKVDGRAMAKLIDFGISSALEGNLITGANLTIDHLLAGSPAYMCPEAIGFGPSDLDTRADVYSLGVLLFELLVGVRPYVSHKDDSLHSMLRRIGEQPVPSLSERWAGLDADLQRTLATSRWTTVQGLRRSLPGDLDAVVKKATEKDREQRYHSPAGLASDLRRYLTHRPVSARPATAIYLLSRFARRHLVATVAVSLLVLTLFAGAAVVGLEARRATLAKEEAEQVSEFLFSLLEMSAPDQARGRAVSARELLDRGAEEIERRFPAQGLAKARFLTKFGPIYRQLGLYGQADALVGEALEIRRRELPSNDPRLAATLYELGFTYRLTGRYEEAEALLTEALAIFQLSDAEPAATALAQAALGRLYLEQGDFEQSEDLYRSALKIQELLWGNEDPRVAETLDGLGAVFYRQERLEDARPLRERALAIRELTLAGDHPELATSLNNLGVLYEDLGLYEKAASYLERSLAIRRQVLGTEHHYVASSLTNLGGLYLHLGRAAEAEPLLVRSIEIKRAALEPDHPDLANSLFLLGRLFLDRQQPAEAEAVLAEAYQIRHRNPGLTHPDSVETLIFLILAIEQQASPRVDTAPLHDQLVVATEALEPVAGDQLSVALDRYSAWLRGQGRQAAAEQLEGTWR